MRMAMRIAVVAAACLALGGCPMQSMYPSTITPVYATAGAGGLWVHNGTSWANYGGTFNTVVVAGSGSFARAYVGGTGGVSRLSGGAWTPLTTGLGTPAVNRLYGESNLYAATAAGLAVLNSDGTSWTNNTTVANINDVFTYGSTTYVAADSGLVVYRGPNLVGSTPAGTLLATSTKVTAVFVDFAGDLFVGTNKGLVVELAGTTSFGANRLPGGTQVNQMAMDPNGFLYAATTGGVYKVGTSTALLVLLSSASCVCTDGAGRVYVGPSAGGLQVSSDGGSTWTSEPALAGQTITSVVTTAPLYSF
jgi:ligand-binding sensor domain-containing protein